MSESASAPSRGPVQYVCPSCRLHLLSWTPHTNFIEMYHKVALWTDFWTGDVRLICQYCLGATEILPERLLTLLRQRFGLFSAIPSPERPTTGR